jgi:hypothetical protein
MPDGVKFNIDKWPESPWFWLIVFVLIEAGFFASGKPATAFLLLALGVGIVCLIANINSDSPKSGLWIVVVICLLLVVILGVFAVPSEWQPKAIIPIPP